MKTVPARIPQPTGTFVAPRKTQAQAVIDLFGGAKRLADLLGCEESTVYRWTYARAVGGCDGLIPSRKLRRVLDLAREQRIAITADVLYPST